MNVKETVLALLRQEHEWAHTMFLRHKQYAKEDLVGDYDDGLRDAYDECQNSLLRLIEEVEKL